MVGFSQFLKGFFAGDNVRDYEHASRLFRDDGYRLAPKTAYLFYVVFTLNPALRSQVTFDTSQGLEVGALCKTVTLPGFTMDVRDRNQYGRHVYTQHRMNYDDVAFTLHDDRDNVVLEFWDNYYKYYYIDSIKDRQQGINRLVSRDTYNDVRLDPNFGMAAGQRLPFLQDIRIYTMYQKKFTEYVLVRPVITNFKHGDLDVANGTGLLQHSFSVKPETVLYGEGFVSLEGNPVGFGIHYDRKPSALANNTTSILGPGGAVDSIGNVITDIGNGNILGAVLSGGKALDNFRNADLGAVVREEGIGILKDVLLRGRPLNDVFSFPKTGSGSGPSPDLRTPPIIPPTVEQQTNISPTSTVQSNGEGIAQDISFTNQGNVSNREHTRESTTDNVAGSRTLNTREGGN